MAEDGAILGRLILLRTENARVKHRDLAAWFEELRLDPTYLPSPARPVDAFKKATSSTVKLTYAAPWWGESALVTIRWVEDNHDADRIVRRAERTVTIKRKTTEPEIIGRVTFYKRSRRAPVTGEGGEKLRFSIDRDKIPGEGLPVFERWLNDVHHHYTMWLEYVDGDALRGVVRRYLTEALDAIMVRPGVYFVFAQHEEENKALAELVPRFGDECMFHPIELMRTDEHVRMLSSALINHAEAEALGIDRDLMALSKRYPRNIPAGKAQPLLVRYEDLMTLIHDYASAVGISDGAPAVDRLTEHVVNLRHRIQA